MFELLANGTVEMLCNKIRDKGITYGFGGIAKLGQGDLRAEYIIAEHYRLGSTMAILSRSFCNAKNIDDIPEIEKVFNEGLKEIRAYESQLKDKSSEFFENNRNLVNIKTLAIKNHKVASHEKVADK
jgi:hypothetical protein